MSNTYQNPLITRYSSPEMSELWSPQRKFSTWRKLWVALAEAEREVGLTVITTEQIEAMRAQIDNIDFEIARAHEKRLRHDVMAHIEAFGDACPVAKGKIHLGATSCFVTDNADLILLREGLEMIRNRLAGVISQLGSFAAEHRALPCLAFTHLQPAQPTTVGKRACLWAYDLVLDLTELEHRLDTLAARSTKGTTGTQASFMALFDGDEHKVRQLEKIVAEKLGFENVYAVTGQTYPRKIDSQILDVLSGVAQSAHKAATDLRLLSSRREIDEPFEENQVGSSAMPYKKNPMRSERICSLARFVISLQSSAANTVATQWMERTLDDSANRRLILPQAFLALDAILILYQNIAEGMRVYPHVTAKNLGEELPFMVTENILMDAVGRGGDRQELHERIRVHSNAAGWAMKNEGKENDLIERIQADESFAGVDFPAALNPNNVIGRAPSQVDEFIHEHIEPIRQRYAETMGFSSEVHV